jgi:hypothetical protein
VVGDEAIDDLERRVEFFLGLRRLCEERGIKPGAAAHRYKARFGQFPPWSWNNLAPIEPTTEVRRWDRQCTIRYAKGLEARKAG